MNTPPARPAVAIANPLDDARRFGHEAMACEWEIFVVGETPDYAAQASGVAFEEIDRVERDLSRFRTDSDVTRLNSLPPGESLRIGPIAFDCLELAAAVSAATAGAFDVTIGGLLRSAGGVRKEITPLEQRSSPPAPAAAVHGMRFLHLDRAARTVRKDIDGLVIDFGAIGKGYGVDVAAETLREWRIRAALIHSGQSSLFAIGSPDGAAAWMVEIRDPQSGGALGRVALRNASVSGSGIRIHGRHIVDPRHGTATAGRAGAWAIAGSAALSDAVSTAAMVLADDELEAFSARFPDIALLTIDESGAKRTLGPWQWVD